MITRFAHVCLNVRDIQATIDFYSGKLGMPVHFTFEKKGKVIGAYFKAGDRNFVEAFEDRNVKPVNTGIVHMCLETDDIAGMITRLTAKGVACSEQKLGCDQSWQSWLADPDGNKIELHQYTPASSQLKGGKVEVDW